MSDTSTTTPPADDLFGATDLAQVVKADEKTLATLNKKGEKTISLDQAKAELVRRLGQLAADSGTQPDEIAGLIAGAIPTSVRTVSVLQDIDLRPYLAALDGKIIDRLGGGFAAPSFGPGGAVSFGGAPGEGAAYRAQTKPYIDAETSRIAGVLQDLGDPSRAEAAMSFPANTAGINPIGGSDVQSATPLSETTLNQTTIDGQPSYTTVLQAGGAQGFPADTIRALVKNGVYDLEQAATREITEQANYPSGYLPVTVGQAPSPDATGKAIGMPHPQVMGINEAMSYVQTLKPEEVHSLQLKLAAAGYFDQLDNGGTYLDGDAFDLATNAAWKLLLTDTIKQNRPADAVLGEKLKTYRTQVRDARLRQLSRFDPTYARAVADDYAQSAIGSNLTPDEADRLYAHLQTIIKERAGHISGTGDGSTSLPNEQGYTQADIQANLGADPGIQREQRDTNAQGLDFKLKAAMH